MINKHVTGKLRDFYDVKSDPTIFDGDIPYTGSLTPNWDRLRGIKKIKFFLGYINLQIDQVEVKHQNQTNSHIFKPIFYSQENSRELHCHVLTKDILFHTLNGIAKALYWLKVDSDIEVEINFGTEMFSDLTNGWKINDSVIVGRKESLENFVRLLWLLDNKVIGLDKFKEISLSLEASRLQPTDNLKYKEYIKLANKELGLIEQSTVSLVAQSSNIKYLNKNITLVQLSWGQTMTNDLFSRLYEINPNITKIAMIGGAGYNGSDAVDVDDIFYPTSVVSGNDHNGYSKMMIENSALTESANKLFNNKKVTSGSMYSIVQNKGVISNYNLIKNNGGKINAFDMEMDFICKIVAKHPNTRFLAACYIMDLPAKKLDLGNTYYNLDFLTKLFSNFNRGKYFCMEKALQFITK
ncbi:MAG: hypothetical protein KJ847_02810 [Firmicutes bacterium]|nr:hypothetical protein [Bacillota bacterium]